MIKRTVMRKTSMLLSMVLMLTLLVPVLAYAASKVDLIYDADTGNLSGTIYSDQSSVGIDVYGGNQTASLGTYLGTTVYGSTYEISVNANINMGLIPEYVKIYERNTTSIVASVYNVTDSVYDISQQPANPDIVFVYNLFDHTKDTMRVQIIWDKPIGYTPQAYIISVNDVTVGQTTDTTFSTEPLLRDNRYKIGVRAIDGAGNSSMERYTYAYLPADLESVAFPNEYAPGAYLKPGDVLFTFKPSKDHMSGLIISLPSFDNGVDPTVLSNVNLSKLSLGSDLTIVDDAGVKQVFEWDQVFNFGVFFFILQNDLQKGKTYTIKMSETSSGDEIQLPNVRAQNAQASIGLSSRFNSMGEMRTFNDVKIGDWTAPAVPTGLAAYAGNQQVSLSWNAVQATDLAGYNLYQNGNLVKTVTETTYTVTGLTNGTEYSFQVASVDKLGNVSAKSEAKKAVPYVSSGGGIGVPPSNNTPEGAVIVNESSLRNGKDGKVTVEIADGKKLVLLPANAAEMVGKNKLEIKVKGVTVELPKEVLEQLTKLVSADVLKDAQLKLSFDKVVEADVKTLLGKATKVAKADLTAAGDVFEFSLAVVAKDGKETKLTKFDKPITLKLKVNDKANKNLIGVYYIGDNGELEYVGGTFADGVMTADIYHFSKYAVLEFKKSYTDVLSTHWAFDTITNLSAKHVVDGVSDTEFNPSGNVKRAEFATLLVRAFGIQSVTGAVYFNDVDADAWYAGSVAAASEAGIITGRAEGQFVPEATITREEMAVMIVRAYEYVKGTKVTASTKAAFSDAAAVSAWAASYVDAAAELKLLNGRENNLFAPSGTATRAESAQVIANLLTVKK